MIIITTGIVLSLILMIGALSGLFSEKAGIVNIAINGMMIGGAIIYWVMSKNYDLSSWGMQIVGYLTAFIGGIAIGLLFGFATITLKANQVIAGTAMNLLFAAIGAFLYIYLDGPSTSLLKQAPAAIGKTQLDFTYIFGVILILATIIFVVTFVFMKFTPWGLRLKAAGENPSALDSQGISVSRTRYVGVMISGALAATAGAMYIQTLGSYGGNVAGLGFVSLAILIAGQWSPLYILISAFGFGILYSAGINLSVLYPHSESIQTYRPLMQAAPFILALVALVVTSKRSQAPKAAGIAYDKSKR